MDIIEAQGDDAGCLYDDALHCDTIHGRPVYKAGDVSAQGPMIISIGSNRVRKSISERYSLIEYAKALYPQAVVSSSAEIGAGSVVMQGAVIQSDVHIGKHCICITSASMDYDCRIGDFVHISPHATLCGNIHVGEGSWIGAGAIVIPGIQIGRWCTAGTGAVVIKNIPGGATVVGNPARIIKSIINMQNSNELIKGDWVKSCRSIAWLRKSENYAA